MQWALGGSSFAEDAPQNPGSGRSSLGQSVIVNPPKDIYGIDLDQEPKAKEAKVPTRVGKTNTLISLYSGEVVQPHALDRVYLLLQNVTTWSYRGKT